MEKDETRNLIYLINKFNKDLPGYLPTIKELVMNESLSNKVFSTLKNSSYFEEVWQLKPTQHLIINLLILLYRTSVLIEHSDILIGKQNTPKVQISSALEEMICYKKIQEKESILFPAIKIWIENWKEEGFDKRLYALSIKKIL